LYYFELGVDGHTSLFAFHEGDIANEDALSSMVEEK
jgi:hypothetical protein